MNESVFNPFWYRVAGLKPRLRSHAQIHRHHYRGQPWYVLQDHSSGRHHRFTPAAHAVIGLMDGKRTVHEIWETAAQRLVEDAPTQTETIQILARLHAADLLQCDVSPDTAEVFERHERQRGTQRRKHFSNPLSIRFPLLDPEGVLEGLAPLSHWLFSWLGALLWIGVVASGATLAAVHWDDLTHNLTDRLLSVQNLLLLWLTYPVIKAIHELAHGLAIKVRGGEVHEAGIMLLVFMPVPYVEASASSSFPYKTHRMLVGAAGIGAELFLAALALFVWLNVEPGIVHTVAYNTMLIGGISTLFFNGNPLLRFDGYYVLADAVEIPNLGPRSARYIGYLLQRYVFGLRDAESPATTSGERVWFIGYGVTSFIYRMFILFFIVVFIASKFFIAGIVLGIWALFMQIGLPLYKGVKFLAGNPQVRRRRLRVLCSTAGMVVLVALLVFVVPMPLSTRAEGIVWLPERAVVRSGTQGFIRRLLAESDSVVQPGDPLILCEDPLLDSRVDVLDARLAELEARFNAVEQKDRVEAEVVKEELKTVEAALERARERKDELVIRSPAAGVFVVPRVHDLPGRFARQGDLLGYVLDDSEVTLRVVVTQADIGLVRRHTEGVEVKLAGEPADTFPATVRREVPAADDRLPSAALGTAGGGPIPVDPSDPKGLKALQPVFEFELALTSGVRVPHKGARAFVRFDHGAEPLFKRWYRRGRQLFLKRFDV
ncbi:MAG: HlyD family efflux transporter periplasmic adaptor subunit [Gammaproteobacteria bacterium]|nr:HlyD family efflux transporter periplasmic adaptor subunit [Gammaproteobacteria bacterium]NIR84981.1 HlyD family efflux transporter periplasmic adaptor subunit [Gammaproteobacteria bacterium]NIR91830.1 HlyD family efflux transporter periplasmic adaptor subunit [Gammaproteobacteria bacterium]NIU06028.1 HlyD family efflux transporter periplasmic adaptor subunit [Gammaproteobacteria bacterium]NIV53075.1 HlyD family efflux transporter periplasmic adaptor subunit [Gammaproteobacteria bacterium]